MISRLWSALASLGAGLILFAVAAGCPAVVAIPLVLIALAHVVYGLLTLRARAAVLPRLTPVACGITMMISVVLLFTGLMAVVPFAALFVLQWAVAVIVVIDRRRRPAPDASGADPGPRPGRLLAGLAVGAMAVAAITTPALALTEPGAAAVPHGESHDPQPHSHH